MAIILIRTVILFFSLLLTMRLLGKRQLGELELSELVVGVVVADLASNPLQDIGIPLLNGLVPIVVLFCCELLISGLSLRHIRLRELIYGRPSLLIRNGSICQAAMAKNRFTLDELTEELRSQGYLDISKIQYAILENNGQLSVLPFPGEQPATAAQLGITVEDPGMPVILISDGRVLERNLQRVGRDTVWLQKELSARGVQDPREVYLFTLDTLGRIYYAGRERT